MDLPELSNSEMVLRLALAAALGAAVGFEREWRDRTAGLRTHMLVCVGAAVFTMISAYGFADWYQSFNTTSRSGVVSDPSRIAAQIVSGIGFLGAGAIFRSDDGIRGLTTAASLWAMAGIGMAVGAGMYELSTATTVMLLLVLMGLRAVKGRIQRMNRGIVTQVRMTVSDAHVMSHIFETVSASHGAITDFRVATPRMGHPGRIMSFGLQLPVDDDFGGMVQRLSILDGVEEVSAADLEAN